MVQITPVLFGLNKIDLDGWNPGWPQLETPFEFQASVNWMVEIEYCRDCAFIGNFQYWYDAG